MVIFIGQFILEQISEHVKQIAVSRVSYRRIFADVIVYIFAH